MALATEVVAEPRRAPQTGFQVRTDRSGNQP
jgi:hypothetical protein